MPCEKLLVCSQAVAGCVRGRRRVCGFQMMCGGFAKGVVTRGPLAGCVVVRRRSLCRLFRSVVRFRNGVSHIQDGGEHGEEYDPFHDILLNLFSIRGNGGIPDVWRGLFIRKFLMICLDIHPWRWQIEMLWKLFFHSRCSFFQHSSSTPHECEWNFTETLVSCFPSFCSRCRAFLSRVSRRH